jgi:hypothetical protein
VPPDGKEKVSKARPGVGLPHSCHTSRSRVRVAIGAQIVQADMGIRNLDCSNDALPAGNQAPWRLWSDHCGLHAVSSPAPFVTADHSVKSGPDDKEGHPHNMENRVVAGDIPGTDLAGASAELAGCSGPGQSTGSRFGWCHAMIAIAQPPVGRCQIEDPPRMPALCSAGRTWKGGRLSRALAFPVHAARDARNVDLQ